MLHQLSQETIIEFIKLQDKFLTEEDKNAIMKETRLFLNQQTIYQRRLNANAEDLYMQKIESILVGSKNADKLAAEHRLNNKVRKIDFLNALYITLTVTAAVLALLLAVGVGIGLLFTPAFPVGIAFLLADVIVGIPFIGGLITAFSGLIFHAMDDKKNLTKESGKNEIADLDSKLNNGRKAYTSFNTFFNTNDVKQAKEENVEHSDELTVVGCAA